MAVKIGKYYVMYVRHIILYYNTAFLLKSAIRHSNVWVKTGEMFKPI